MSETEAPVPESESVSVSESGLNLRPCGECFACCVVVGREALKKYPNQSCSKLDGTDPCKRCSIYETRPTACSTFACAWKSGLGEDFMRPDLSGLMIAYYPSEINLKKPEEPVGIQNLAVTITIIDPAKAGTTIVGNLRAVLDALVELGFVDIRVISYETKNVIYFLNGEIRSGKLSDPEKGNYEGLKFFLYDKLLGTFERKEKDS